MDEQDQSAAEQSSYATRPIDWESLQGEEARRIRFKVFVDEQKVPEHSELDDIDPIALHVISHDSEGVPHGTGRLFTDPVDPTCAHIGRMAVLKASRGTGCGASIMRALIKEARKRGYKRIVLSAQEHAIAFYEKFGFQASGPTYMDCNIPHRDMWLVLE
jgi:predicted GNAT family N-acyltransferase